MNCSSNQTFDREITDALSKEVARQLTPGNLVLEVRIAIFQALDATSGCVKVTH